ncbi:TPA: peptidase S74, partial [Bacillus thuringiensis]|nr:peptidase S74 [Bacillus thuringiensis]
LQQSIKDVKKDIETARTELNQKVQSVESKAQEIAEQIVDVQKQVNGKVDQTWIDNQLKDKADKSGVYTKDEIKDGFIGKQIYETDKQGNVQKFKDINTSIGQTNEALTQKAEKAELKKTNDGLSQLETKTNEIKTTAEGTKQTLTELKTQVDNTVIGVRNYVLTGDREFTFINTNETDNKGDTLEISKDAYNDFRGKQVYLSFDAETTNLKHGTASNNSVGIELRVEYADGKTSWFEACYGKVVPEGTNRYKRYGRVSQIIEDKEIKYIRLQILLRSASGTVKMKNFQVEAGNKPSSFKLANEDQVTGTDFTKKTVEIENSIKGVNTTVSDIQNEQGKLTERVTKSEQTADGFKTSIESLTKKDTEISNKLNTVESTVEGTKKTISDVQQTTNDLKKTTTEITEQAGKLSEKLTTVETKVNNDKTGGRNLLLDSNVKYEKNDYLINQYSLTENFSTGEEYTFVIKGAVPAGQKFGIWMNGGSSNVGYATSIYANGITYVTFKAVAATSGNERKLSLYNFPSNTTKGVVEWVALYKGNKPQDWTPAPENQVTSDEFTKKTTEIEKSVDGVKSIVSTVQKDQGTMQTTLNQVKQTTDSNSQTITTLSQTQGKQGEVIQQNTSDITQLNNQIKSKVTDTQMQEYVGGLGSTNLLFNAAFEDRVINATTGVVTSRKPSISKWSVGPNGSNFTAVPETARNHDGMNSVKLESSGQTVDRNAAFYQSLPVSPSSGDYVLSAWFYTDAVATIDNTAFVMIEFYNGSTWVTNKVVQLVPLLTNGSWKFVSVTMPTPASGVTTIRFVVVIRKNGRLWVSQPQLQQGITPSSFMENPKDYANYDQLVGEIAKKVATADFDSKVSKMETTINQQSNRIDLKAEKTDVYTKTEANGQFGSKAMVEKHESSISLMSDQITNRVQKGDIISSINQTAEKITIEVSKLAINADTMVQWLTAKGIDTNIIKVNGDKITIDKNGVTVKMLDFLFEDEWGTKTTVMPKRNLIADHDFSSVPKLNIGNSNYQGFGAGYGLPWKVQGNGVVIENNTFTFNYEQMVNAVRVDTYNYPETKVQNGIHPGNSYTLSAHYRTAQINGVRVTAKPRLQVCFVTPLDEVSYKIWHETYKDFPEPSTFYGEIRRYNFTFTVPNNYNPQEHMIVVKVTAANAQVSAGRAVCVSGITLVSGNYACMYNWDRTAAERADGIQPFRRIALGDTNTNIGISDDGYTVDFTTNKEFKFFTNIRAVQGVNMGGNQFQGWGHIRFTDGNLGPGFYVSTPNGWKFNALG